MYVLQIKNKKIRPAEVIKRLAKEGIGSKPYLPSIHLFDFYKKSFGHKVGDFPISESVSAKSIALPIFIGLTKKEIAYIVERFVAILNPSEI